jgi:Protein of unknown function (DUF4242)
MPRYLVQRTFHTGFGFPVDASGRRVVSDIVGGNLTHGVTWVHSYVSEDDRVTWCVYDAGSPEAIRRAAAATQLPVDSIRRVTVLDPYFYSDT